MYCKRCGRELVESPKIDVEFPIKYETIFVGVLNKQSYAVGYTLYIRTCPHCDIHELLIED